MNRLTVALEQKKGEFIPFITCGDPSLEATRKLIHLLAEEGALAIELGVPFSDPIADGPVIQAASERALANGITLSDVLRMGKSVRDEGIEVPLILFTYANPVYRHGLKKLVYDAVASGFDGIIVPDLPYEESEDLRQWGEQAGLPVIPLVAPTSRERIADIVSSAQGFVYCVSSLGTTGMRQDFAVKVEEFLETVRSVSPVPTAVGFGISNRSHVTHFLQYTDAVVVGSALVKHIEERQLRLTSPGECEKAFGEIRAFVRQLKTG